MQLQILNPEAIQGLIRDLGQLPAELRKPGKLRSLLEKIRDEVLIPEFTDQFLEGGKPPWDPVSPATLAARKRGGGDAFIQEGRSFRVGAEPPLTDRGVFRRSAWSKVRFRIRDNSMSYGNFPENMWWALPVHELGRAEAANIPRRSWVGQTLNPRNQAVLNEITDITWDWVKDRIDDALTRRVYR